MATTSQRINGSITTNTVSSNYQTNIQPLKRGGIVSFYTGSELTDERDAVTLARVSTNDDTERYYTLDGVLSPCDPPDNNYTWSKVAW